MKTALVFMSGVVVGAVAVPIAFIAACVIVETRDPSTVKSEVVTDEEK